MLFNTSNTVDVVLPCRRRLGRRRQTTSPYWWSSRSSCHPSNQRLARPGRTFGQSQASIRPFATCCAFRPEFRCTFPPATCHNPSVDANNRLFDAHQVEQTRVLTRLAFGLHQPCGYPLDSRGKVTIGRDHQQGDISLRGARDHVLDKISVSRRVDDGVVPLVREKTPWSCTKWSHHVRVLPFGDP